MKEMWIPVHVKHIRIFLDKNKNSTNLSHWTAQKKFLEKYKPVFSISLTTGNSSKMVVNTWKIWMNNDALKMQFRALKVCGIKINFKNKLTVDKWRHSCSRVLIYSRRKINASTFYIQGNNEEQYIFSKQAIIYIGKNKTNKILV